ncbi:RNA polymerase sigma factor [Pseudomonas sp. CGJS7]|uniref:RNA polymerase sigma factor n=1 Tax=Pseudomonas sp. CGJS7 TaxID=3109348 RepID=UPI00300B5254
MPESSADSAVEPRIEPGQVGGDSDRLWARLMQQAQDGDRVAYHALLQAVVPYVRAITRRYLGPGEDAEDAVQDVLMIVHGIRHTYECGRPFKPWLSTIATRRCIDLLRKRQQRLKHEIESADGADEHPQVGHGPEEAVSRHHAASAVREAVAALPQRQREAVRLLRLNELSLNEAAAQSDQSVGSLKVACHRALKSLHSLLAKKGPPHE